MVQSPNKWFRPEPGVQTVTAAALQVLRDRLSAVTARQSPAVRLWRQDHDHIRRLRVATRRAQAALQLFHQVLPTRRAAQLRQHLRALRRAAGTARDLDILIDELARGSRLPSNPLQEWLDERRQSAQQPLTELADGTAGERAAASLLERLERRVEQGRDGGPLLPWARAQLRRGLHRFRRRLPPGHADAEVLHRSRIAGKRLRYTIELLAFAEPRLADTGIYGLLRSYQDLLGRFNDHVSREALLRGLVTQVPGHRVTELERLHDQQLLHLQQARTAVDRALALQFLDALREDLDPDRALAFDSGAANGHSDPDRR